MTRNYREEVTKGLTRLKLATVRDELDDYLRLAETRSLSYLEFLNGLIQRELSGREEANFTRRMRAAKFPAAKRLDEFDFAFQPSIPLSRMNGLRDCRWIENAANVVFAGQTGTGKSHLAIGLGVEAVERGYKIYFTTIADLLDDMKLAALTGQLMKLQSKLLKYDGLILDELGYVRINRDEGNFLFSLISKAYERMALIVTTNKEFSAWGDVFEDRVQVAAMLDRLLHHCVLFSINGESYRMKGRTPKGSASDE